MADPWDALLNPTPQSASYNPIPNPQMDQLMGFDAQPGDDAATRFMKGFQSAQFRNSPQGQQMNMEMAKEKLAEQMQMQLFQQKIQLERENPEYKVFPTQYGALMVNPRDPTDVQTMEGIPGALANYQAGLAASTAENNMKATPQYIQSQEDLQKADIGYKNAQAKYMNSLPELRQAQADLAAARQANIGKPKPLDWQGATLQAAQEVTGILGKGDMQLMQINAAMQDPDTKQKIMARAQQLMQGTAVPVSPGIAAPQAVPQPPDLSGLLDSSTLGQ